MNILLVDADSKKGFPNLALMKLSAWHKQQGDHVELIKGIPTTAPLEQYDKTYISCVFFQNKDKVLDYASQLDNVIIGGSGYDLCTTLNEYIEHIMPDYSLYNIDFSMGFTSRGCIRNCGFCIVPQKEGLIHDHAPLTEFLAHDKVILLDNNFQASPKWRTNIQYLIDHKIKVNFNQGLDARLITPEFAQYLTQTRYYDWKFKYHGFQIAFDDIRYEQEFRRGVRTLLDTGINPKHIMVYILSGYNSTSKDDLYRVNTVLSYGMKPYIMPYNNTKDKQVRHLARYINRKYYEFIDIQDYNNGVLVQ